MEAVEAAPKTKKKSETTLLLIALFKLVKGILLLAVAIGAFRLVNRDVGDTLTSWVQMIRVDPDSRFIHKFIARALSVSPGQLKALGVGTLFYSALLSTEGVGLLMRKRWAEYFTIISTALLIPLELYEIYEHVTVAKIWVLIVNIAIVVYLVVRILRARKLEKSEQA